MGLHDGHRQRAKDRYRQLGADALADHELLELALFYAIPRQDTNETAHRLLKRFRSLQGVLQATPEELEKEEGVGRSAALLLCLGLPLFTGLLACAPWVLPGLVLGVSLPLLLAFFLCTPPGGLG